MQNLTLYETDFNIYMNKNLNHLILLTKYIFLFSQGL